MTDRSHPVSTENAASTCFIRVDFTLKIPGVGSQGSRRQLRPRSGSSAPLHRLSSERPSISRAQPPNQWTCIAFSACDVKASGPSAPSGSGRLILDLPIRIPYGDLPIDHGLQKGRNKKTALVLLRLERSGSDGCPSYSTASSAGSEILGVNLVSMSIYLGYDTNASFTTFQ